MKVFISGATGFVGSYLIKYLSPLEYEIFGTSFPDKPGKDQKNIFFLDIRNEDKIFDAIKRVQPDWIFHLAAISNVSYSWEKKKETLETNLIGTFNLFEAAKKFAPKARVLFVSSSNVYGVLTPIDRALKEEDSTHIVNPYAFTKFSGEILGKFYGQIEELDIVIARPFSHTGPGQDSSFVCSDWALQIAQIEKGLVAPVIKVGNCKVKRDFTDVRDVVRAYVLLLQKGRRGEVYNICSGHAVALEEILNILRSYSEEKIDVRIDENKLRKIDIPLLMGNNRKIAAETSWKSEIQLTQTLKDLLEYWRKKVNSSI